MMTKQRKPSLYKDPDYDLLDKELRISVKSLLLIVFIVFLFFIVACTMIPQTYGFL